MHHIVFNDYHYYIDELRDGVLRGGAYPEIAGALDKLQTRDLKWLCEPLASPEAAPYSAAHVSGAMARLSQAPVFVLTAPYASAPPIAMAVGTAAAERGCRFNRR